MMKNSTMMQYFEWYIPADHQHWNKLATNAKILKEAGIDMVWMPPAFKGTNKEDVGYGVYDLYDLGEFDQKGTVPTKYGTKDEYLNAIKSLKEAGIFTIADIVLNHKADGDAKERFQVRKVDPQNRNQVISDAYEIEGWTHFNFPGRAGKYDNFEWHSHHFTGLDWDALNEEKGVFQIVGEHKGWSQEVDGENGNYDYLMYSNVDYNHPEVVAHLKNWVKWFVETTQIDGFRLDAVKHIDYGFMSELIDYVKSELNPNLYSFAEYWKGDAGSLANYIEKTERRFDLVDVVLHMNLFNASRQAESYDLRTILDGSLMKHDNLMAVTFVDNHDSQRGQALESCVEEWFKPSAYAIILLRQQGLPCVFYGDYYGISGQFAQQDFQDVINKLLYLRKEHTYGEQVDYFDNPNCIAWVNKGNEEHPNGSAVLISNADSSIKRMDMGIHNAGKEFVDFLGNNPETVVVDQDGWANFLVNAKSVSVWVAKESFN
ncbi:MAG: alpha-amylase [Gemella sp.]|nr:alpha-amylase [Gemella sp.]